MVEKIKANIFELCGYAAIVLIQGATMPAMLQRIITGSGQLPPLSMTCMIWSGLCLYLIRSIARKDTVGIVSNSIGFFMQSIMLAFITLT